MSCYQCSSRTLNALAHSLVAFGLADKPIDIYKKLYEANDMSVSYRYNEPLQDSKYHDDGFSTEPEKMSAHVVHSQIRNYKYQSCEGHGFDDSHVSKMLTEMEERIAAYYRDEKMGEIPEGPWGLSDSDAEDGQFSEVDGDTPLATVVEHAKSKAA